MAYPVDESFAAGIPADFGQTGGGGGMSVTHNTAAEAVDLVSNNNQNFWRITAADFSTEFWLEYDVELISKAITQWHFGFWLYASGSYGGQRLAYNVNSGSTVHHWQRTTWTESGSEYNNYMDWVFLDEWQVVGARKTLRVDARRDADLNIWLLQVSVDGVPKVRHAAKDYAQLQPAVFAYGCSLRIHGVKGDRVSALPAFESGAAWRTDDHLTRLRPRERTEIAAVRDLPTWNKENPSGRMTGARLTGTVKEKASPANAPVVRRVVLVDQASQRVLRTTWSDAAGNYFFEQVEPERLYTVYSYDHTGAYRAVIADNLNPTPYP